MRNWRIMHKNHDGTNRGQLQPENLSFTMQKGDAGSNSVAYELDLGHSESVDMVQFQEPYRTDFELSVDGYIIIAGMHTEIAFSTDDNFVQIAGKDWLHYLEKRQYPFDPMEPNQYRDGDPERGLAMEAEGVDVGTIIGTILARVLDEPYSLDMTYTVPDMETPIDFELALADTSSIQSKIAELGENATLFDFWVTPSKELQFAVPRQYDETAMTDSSACALILNNDVTVRASITSTGPDCTRFVGYGAGNEVRLGLELMDVNQMGPYRRLDGNDDYGDVAFRARVDRLATGDYYQRKFPQETVTIEVQAEDIGGFWPAIRPGCAIWIDNIPVGLYLINGGYELLELSGDVSNEGGETIALTLEPIRLTEYSPLAQQEQIPEALEPFFYNIAVPR